MQFSSQAFGGVIQMLFSENEITSQDFTHTINHLSFGVDAEYKEIKK
jgi:hypothetical protein